jgi:HlyD family secretion protein
VKLTGVDRRPSPRVAVLPLYVVGALTALAGAALTLVQVDRVVVGRGVLIPPSNSVVVATARSGVVAEVLAREGELVPAGAPIVRLEGREERAAIEALEAELEVVRAEVARREELARSRRRLTDVQGELARRAVSSEEAALGSVEADAVRRARDLERRARREERDAALAKGGLVAAEAAEDAVALADEARAEQARVAALLDQKRRELDRLRRHVDGVALEGAVGVLEDEVDGLVARARAAELGRFLAEARLRLERASVAAPVAGRVHALTVRAAGELLLEGATVARLVPPEASLLAEVELPASDIGLVALGQRARLKLDAFPFEDYGVVPGRVEFVSPDAAPAATEGRARRPVYVLRIALDEPALAPPGRPAIVPRPGMTLAAEMVCRKESLGAVLFRPLRAAAQEVSLR